jgi:hypothetical protein
MRSTRNTSNTTHDTDLYTNIESIVSTDENESVYAGFLSMSAKQRKQHTHGRQLILLSIRLVDRRNQIIDDDIDRRRRRRRRQSSNL